LAFEEHQEVSPLMNGYIGVWSVVNGADSTGKNNVEKAEKYMYLFNRNGLCWKVATGLNKNGFSHGLQTLAFYIGIAYEKKSLKRI